jgi:tetratricopeptide (TPR) repeat protein
MTRDSLLDEILLREASLADARAEHAAGELSDAEWAALEQRENTALETLRASLAEWADRPSVAATPPRRRRRSLLLIALACFAVAAAGLVIVNLSLRQAGTSITGGVSASSSQHLTELLNQGQADLAAGNDVTALAAYEQVLALQPHNVAALTEVGWLDFSAGASAKNATLVLRGTSELRLAVNLAPSDPAPRLYYAIVAAATPGNQSLAATEFRAFLRLTPTAEERAIAAPFLARLGLVG